MGEEWNVPNANYQLGQVITMKGFLHFTNARYRVTKVTSTAIAVERYYWFDALSDWIVRKVKSWRSQ